MLLAFHKKLGSLFPTCWEISILVSKIAIYPDFLQSSFLPILPFTCLGKRILTCLGIKSILLVLSGLIKARRSCRLLVSVLKGVWKVLMLLVPFLGALREWGGLVLKAIVFIGSDVLTVANLVHLHKLFHSSLHNSFCKFV